MRKAQLIILDVLRSDRKWWFGLEMIKADPRIKRGVVYAHLSKLEDEGYVESQRIDTRDGVRIQYRITNKGRGKLIETEQEPSALEWLIGKPTQSKRPAT